MRARSCASDARARGRPRSTAFEINVWSALNPSSVCVFKRSRIFIGRNTLDLNGTADASTAERGAMRVGDRARDARLRTLVRVALALFALAPSPRSSASAPGSEAAGARGARARDARRALGVRTTEAAHDDALTAWNASDESIVSPLRCQRRAVFGECVQEVGCGWCDSRDVDGHNPTCYSLLDAALCVSHLPPVMNAPRVVNAVTNEIEIPCDPRCAAIGNAEHCAKADGCGWCAASSTCMSGSVYNGPCRTCAYNWTYSAPTPTCVGAMTGDGCATCGCENNGVCAATSKECICPDAFTGSLCQFNTTTNNGRDACNGHGTWDATAKDCVCDRGWVGVGDNRCKFSCSPSVDCNGNGYCSERDGTCVCDLGFAGESCSCLSQSLVSYPYPDALLNTNKTGCCPYSYIECPSGSLNAGQCVIAPADTTKCPVESRDDGFLVFLGLLLFFLGMYLSAAIIAAISGHPDPTCTVVVRLPTIVRLRDSLFMRNIDDVNEMQTISLTCKLTDNFQKVKRMVCRRLKHQPDPDSVDLFYLGCLVDPGWRLGDGINVAQTCHVHLKLRGNHETHKYTSKKKALKRLRYIFSDNVIIFCLYFFFILSLSLCASTWSWDRKNDSGIPSPPPPPSPTPFSPPPFPPPPSPPPSPAYPPPPPAAWIDLLNAQNTVNTNATFGTDSTFIGADQVGHIPTDILALESITVTYATQLAVTSNSSGNVVNFYTYEDGPLWQRELPLFTSRSGIPFVANIFTVCDPRKAVEATFQVEMNAGYGVVSYQPKPNENGVDVFTFRGTVEYTVAQALGLDTDGTVDCSPAVLALYNNSCTTDIKEARVDIAKRNDAPVAAGGEQILSYESTADIIPMRTQVDATATGSKLSRPMTATDIDGDRLTWTIRQQPAHGTLELPAGPVAYSSTFEYIPDINFTGYDYFIYSVDDSLDNTPDTTLYDVASVVVAVGSATGKPVGVVSHYWVDEDTTMTGRFGRTIMASEYAGTLTYTVTNAGVQNGTVTKLCNDVEVQYWWNCSVNTDDGNLNFQYFNYTPSANFTGTDSIEFSIVSSYDSTLAASASVNVTIRPVNDPPFLANMEVNAVMNRDRAADDLGDADLTPITFSPYDVDAGPYFRLFLTWKPIVTQSDWATRRRGRWYKSIDRFGRPMDEITAATLDQVGLLNNGTSITLYYLAPPLLYGFFPSTTLVRQNPLEKYAIRVVDDGSLVSAEATLNIHVGCALGYTTESASAVGDASNAKTYGTCTICPLGQVTDAINSHTCRACPVGMAGGTVQRGFCTRCSNGYYSDTPGLATCISCPAGSTSVQGATSRDQCFCNIGWYGVPGYCFPCPEYSDSYGAPERWTYCAETNLTVPYPQPGFYVVSPETRSYKQPISMRQCFPHKACPGVKGIAGSAQVDAIAAGGSSADAVQCAEGYVHDACETCVTGYYRLNGQCLKCGSALGHTLYGAGVGLVMLSAILMPWLIDEQSFRYIVYCRILSLVVFLQEVGMIGRYNLGWNDYPGLTLLLQLCYILQLNPEVIGLECLTEYDFVARWNSLMAMPAIGLALMYGIAQLYAYIWGKFYIKTQPSVEVVRNGQRRWVLMLRSILNVIQITYVAVIIATFDFFIFHRSVTDKFGYIRAQPNLRFGYFSSTTGSTKWQQLFPLALIALLLYPIGFFAIMYWVIKYAMGGWEKLWKRDLIGFATFQFTDDYVWYRVNEMARILALCLIQLLGYELRNGNGVVQALTALLVISVSFATVILRPFKTSEAKRYLGLHLLAMVLVLMLSVISIAPVSYIINQRTKDNARNAVWQTIAVAVFVFCAGIFYEAYSSAEWFKRADWHLRRAYKNFIARVISIVVSERRSSQWLRERKWVEWKPTLSLLNPSAGAILQLESAEGDQGLYFSGNFDMHLRMEFARGIRSLWRHKTVETILGTHDERAKSFYKMLSRPVRQSLIRAAAVDNRDMNRQVQLFIENKMIQKRYNFYRKFYRQAQKDLRGVSGAHNPSVERFLLRDSTLARAKSHATQEKEKEDEEKQLAEYEALQQADNVRRAFQTDVNDAADLDQEELFFQTSEVSGRTHFVRFQGYFGDIHPDWDAYDESLAKAKAEAQDEDGDVLPWHLDLDDVYDDFCCLCECEPGERCARHGNLYVVIQQDDEEVSRIKQERERHFRTRETIIIQEEDPDRSRDLGWNVYVPVRLKEEVSSVHTKLATELRDMRDRGEFAGEDELPAVTGSKFDISHKGKLLDTHNTVKLENLQWKAEVQLENRRGNLAKTTAWLILQDDPEEARDPDEDERMYARPDIEEGPVLAQPVLQSNLVHENPEMTVLDLRRMLADSNSKPLERTILRYRNNGKELIQDAAPLTRKGISKPNHVLTSFEPEDGNYYVWSEIRNHWTFLEGLFKTYASIPSGPSDNETRVGADDHLLMSYRQFMYLISSCKIEDKLPNSQYNQLSAVVRSVFDTVKAPELLAKCLTLDRETGSVEGSLCPSEGPRLELRIKHAWGMHLDEFLTSLVFMAWIIYGHRVPLTDRGVARATRWLIERILRPKAHHIVEAYEAQARFATAMKKQGKSSDEDIRAVSTVYKAFTDKDGMEVMEFKAAAMWAVGAESPLNKFGELVFRTYSDFSTSTPDWVYHGARHGWVHAIDEKPDGYLCCQGSRLDAKKFMLAFGDFCFRANPTVKPSEALQAQFKQAQERKPLAESPSVHAVLEEPSDELARKNLVMPDSRCSICGMTDHEAPNCPRKKDVNCPNCGITVEPPNKIVIGPDDLEYCNECLREDEPEDEPFVCPNCEAPCEPEEVAISDVDGKKHCPRCAPEPFVCPNCETPCEPEDVIKVDGGQFCPKCWSPQRKRSIPTCPNCDAPCTLNDIITGPGGKDYCPRCVPEEEPEMDEAPRQASSKAPAPFECPNCSREMEPEDVMPGPDGNVYCAECFPDEALDDDIDDEDYPSAPAFTKPKIEKAQRQRVARVRKVTKRRVDDDAPIAKPRAFTPSSPPPPKPERERIARVRTVTTTVVDDESVARPRAFARAPSRADRERAEAASSASRLGKFFGFGGASSSTARE